MVPIIQEFYASLWDRESRNTEGCMWDMVLVQGKEVRVTTRIFRDFYNDSYYENDFIDESNLKYFKDIYMGSIINFLTKGRGEWKYRASPNIPKKKVCIGKWIHQNMRRCIGNQKVGVFFTHLVAA
ncbi:hypothetical protein J1N35_044193 [Gossypium stocksii]|uniref:Uncharacterized protein n=1 Tax=Gossypium stocksii TaxID=47602 RepID=A0A9D3U8S6_9ROSI|nr:hypothetical protein J1N35_044193 [Gossypium stocksii]